MLTYGSRYIRYIGNVWRFRLFRKLGLSPARLHSSSLQSHSGRLHFWSITASIARIYGTWMPRWSQRLGQFVLREHWSIRHPWKSFDGTLLFPNHRMLSILLELYVNKWRKLSRRVEHIFFRFYLYFLKLVCTDIECVSVFCCFFFKYNIYGNVYMNRLWLQNTYTILVQWCLICLFFFHTFIKS